MDWISSVSYTHLDVYKRQPLIIRDIYIGVNNFDAMVENLEISRNLLTRRLKHLQNEGIIEHKQNPKSKKVKTYALTEKGNELVPVIFSLTNWGHKLSLIHI